MNNNKSATNPIMVNIFDWVDCGLKSLNVCVNDWIVLNEVALYEFIVILAWLSGSDDEYRGKKGCDFADEL